MANKNANTGNQYGSKSQKMGMKARQISKPVSGSAPFKRGGGLGTGPVGGNNRKGR